MNKEKEFFIEQRYIFVPTFLDIQMCIVHTCNIFYANLGVVYRCYFFYTIFKIVITSPNVSVKKK